MSQRLQQRSNVSNILHGQQRSSSSSDCLGQPQSYEWLLHRRLRIGKESNIEATHYLSDARTRTQNVGGRFVINDNELPQFYAYVAMDWLQGKNIAFVECAPKDRPARLYFDVDLLFEEGLPGLECQQLLGLFTTVQETIKSIFPGLHDASYRLFAGSSGLSFVDKAGKKLQKFGLHLIWPNICCLKPLRLSVRAELVQACIDAGGPLRVLPGTDVRIVNDWEDVWDIQVTNNLTSRMFGCVKWQPCDCKSKKIECQHRSTNGFINRGRKYELAAVVDHDGSTNAELTEEFTQDPEALLSIVSLRYTQPTETDHIPLREIALPTESSPLARLDDGDHRTTAISNLVKSLFPQDANCIQRIMRPDAGSGADPKLFVVQLSSRICANNWGRSHHSSTSYITVGSISHISV